MMLEEMEPEWQAWVDFHKEFTRLTGIDIDDGACQLMGSKLKIWSERVALLRIAQGPIGVKYAHEIIELNS